MSCAQMRALSHGMCGGEDGHMEIRATAVQHMRVVCAAHVCRAPAPHMAKRARCRRLNSEHYAGFVAADQEACADGRKSDPCRSTWLPCSSWAPGTCPHAGRLLHRPWPASDRLLCAAGVTTSPCRLQPTLCSWRCSWSATRPPTGEPSFAPAPAGLCCLGPLTAGSTWHEAEPRCRVLRYEPLHGKATDTVAVAYSPEVHYDAIVF